MRYYGRFPKEKKEIKKKLSSASDKVNDIKLSNKETEAKPNRKKELKGGAKGGGKGEKWINNQTVPEMGDFQEKVVKLLQKSKNPMALPTIAKKLNKSKEFVFVWLCSVGKHIKEIKKISTGRYNYEEKKDK
jgi:hypothetical protein